MPNTHTIPDTMAEIMAREEDLLPACVISTTWPTVPVSSLTLAAFPTQAYVRDAQQLVYVDQPAITVPLTGSDGTYWLSVTRDVSTAYAAWTRRPGSHYAWRLSGTRPPDVDGLLVFASVTVAGGVITAVTPAPGVTRAEAWRALSGLGTMATQNADAVAITGGSAGLGPVASPGFALVVDADGLFRGKLGLGNLPPGVYTLHVNGSTMLGQVNVGAGAPISNYRVALNWAHGGEYALIFRPNDGNDTGAGHPVLFHSAGGAQIGSISTTATATAYNTSSDVRLKRNVATLTAALERVRALRPVSHRWNADDSPGEGFLAHELMVPCPLAVTGLPNEVNDDGSVKPQQVDHSKIVPLLTSGLQAALAQIDALAARIGTLEEALGV